MNEDNRELDEDLSEILWRCHQLKQRAIRELNQKNSFPAWLTCLLNYPPIKDESAGEKDKG